MQYDGEPLLVNCHDYSGQTWADYQRSDWSVLTVWHFKWIDSTREKLTYRVSSYKRQRIGWWYTSARSLKAIYGSETDRLRNAADLESPSTSNPYARLETRAFWKTGLTEEVLPDVWRPKWQLRPEDRVVTFGSCFAQYLGPALRARRFTWWETEPPPQKLSPENALRFGYNRFSCRTGAITTPTSLRQWIGWTLGDEEPPDEYWLDGDRVVDPFRPSIEPGGFVSRAEMLASRNQTLASMQRAILEADVFLFTLGMTESWVHDPGGWVYPACPGTAAGRFDPGRHRFVNLSFLQARRALVGTLERLWAVRPELKVLLSVSPVPLTATASGAHVLAATSYSKSILRAVSGELADRPGVDYFPSYELVMAPVPLFRKQMFEANRRSVSAWAVDRVMDTFFTAHGVQPLTQSRPESGQQAHPTASEADCDDAWAEAFAK
ncbi:MAG: GSCFA domain-containing protein [bacterium]|nr:GSCFA domain-containing protein [bacterium]